MFELNRVLLKSVGPKPARYEDVLLDFRDGERNPAPASVLFLENGGGKSLLLKLLFATLLPGRRNVIGEESDARTLENFVLSGDTGHVVLEWRRVSADGRPLDELLLTGKVYEWQGRQRSADARNLKEAWYTLTPIDGVLTLETLPTIGESDGPVRKRVLSSYRQHLQEINANNLGIGLVWADRQRDWLAHLDSVGLDPELFRYQAEMNVGEGAADKLFNFDSHRAFVDFLLRAVTDGDAPAQLADNVDRYVEKLRQRQRLQLEEQFLDGALELLMPLGAAANHRVTAVAKLKVSQLQASELARSLGLAAEMAAADKLRLDNESRGQSAAASSLNNRVRELRAQLAELRRRATGFRIATAEKNLTDAENAVIEAHDERAGWAAVEPLLSYRSALARVAELERQLAMAELEAAPLLEHRNQTAARYSGALLAAADDANRAADDVDKLAGELATAADDHTKEASVASGAAASLRARADEAERRQADIEVERQRLVRDQLLNVGERAQDALDRLERAQNDAERREQQAQRAIKDIDTETAALTRTESTATRAADTATREANALQTEYDGLASRARQLAANSRLIELADTESVDVWMMADTLNARLVEADAATAHGIILLELEAADDRRATNAIEATGLLPAATQVQNAITILKLAGISHAVSGWDYLAESVAADERAMTLARRPELVGGVLVRAEDLERAEAALTTAGSLPAGVVVLGVTDELLSPDGPARYVIEPNAALYDKDVAEDELEARRSRLTLVADRRRPLDEQTRSDADLSYELNRLLIDSPAGHLDVLLNSIGTLRETAAENQDELTDIKALKSTLTERRTGYVEAASVAASERIALAGRHPTVAAFVGQEAATAGLRETARLAHADADDKEQAARTRTEHAAKLRQQAQEHVRLAEQQRNLAGRLMEDTSRIDGAGESPARQHANVPIEELRSTYETAARVLADNTTESELASEYRAAQNVASGARTRRDEHSSAALEFAETLLGRAPDRAARRAEQKRADDACDQAERARSRIESALEVHRRELEQDTPRDETGRGPRAQLTGELVPQNLDHALQLQGRLEGERDRTQDDQTRASQAASKANEDAQTQNARAIALGAQAESLTNALQITSAEPVEHTSLTAFEGAPEDASQLTNTTVTQLRDANTAVDEAERHVRDRAAALSGFARDETFLPMGGGPLRQTLTQDDTDALASASPSLLPQIELRVFEVRKELASIEQHRKVLVERLTRLVQQGLDRLKQTARVSRLPDNLGDWSGKSFLQVAFDSPESEDVLIDRLGGVIDTAANQSSRDGLSLLLAGVHAAAEPNGYRSTVLKPDTVLRHDRVPVTDMSQFSGGQRLTAAIALYCTLASMRASGRGRRPQRVGVLFLDNPIGKASADYLLEIQLKVARRLGVQLVYTTGVFDMNALAKFACFIRLRNDLDLRAGMQHVHVASDVRSALISGRDPSDESGYLDSARVVANHAGAELPPANKHPT